ncbi:DUF2079 domain-containing protein [Aquihabitans daechungensis]|uniref:DUF2079 domain-containing protein n=1 Tax=Aquihabitans daechungensis TaxID=1052257 RepID=UPI003BA1366F
MNDRAPRPDLRRRWRRFVLRLQGRLDGEAADRILPWALAIATFAVFVALDAAALRSLEGGSGLGPWLQAVWRREHGSLGTPLGGVDPARGAWSLIAEPVLWAGRFVPPLAVFAVVQAGAIALGIVPLWRLAREEARLRVGASAVVVAAYVLAPTLHRTNLAAFHPEAVALPLLLWAFLCARRGHWKRYGLLVGLVLACGASLGLTVVGLGLVLFLSGLRRPGWITAAAGAAWSLLAVVVTGPDLPTTSLTPAGEFVARATGPLAVIPDLAAHPVSRGAELPVGAGGLLPRAGPRAPAVPPDGGTAQARRCPSLPRPGDDRRRCGAGRRAARRGQPLAGGAHVAPALAFVFIALVFALERIGTPSVTRVNVDRRVLFALLAGATLFFVTEAPTSPYRRPWAWGSQDAVDGARLAAAEVIEASGAGTVAVSPSSTSLVAERAHVIELPLDAVNLTEERLQGRVASARWILLDTNGTDSGSRRPYWRPNDPRRVIGVLEGEGFAVIYAAEGIYLLGPDGQG